MKHRKDQATAAITSQWFSSLASNWNHLGSFLNDTNDGAHPRSIKSVSLEVEPSHRYI